jgi:hypothetical protein
MPTTRHVFNEGKRVVAQRDRLCTGSWVRARFQSKQVTLHGGPELHHKGGYVAASKKKKGGSASAMPSVRSTRFVPALAKIARPTLPPVYPRTRLFEALDEAFQRASVIWIEGPPGAGKTTLTATEALRRITSSA